MSVEIRRAGPEDAVPLALLGRVTFAGSFGGLFRDHPGDLRRYLDASFGVEKVARSLAKPENAWWLALRHGLPVGYAKRKAPAAGRGAQLQRLYVLGEFLGEGIGHALLAPVLEEAPALWLAVLRENARAIRFYAAHGFAVLGEERHAIGAREFRFHRMERRG